MGKKLILKLIPAYLVILSLAFYALFSQVHRQLVQSQAISQVLNLITQKKEQNDLPAFFSGKPKQLLIPRLGINIVIENGNYQSTNKAWDISNDKAHFALLTTIPNNRLGNTIIYGHNTDSILGKTSELKYGDELFLLTENNLAFKYFFVSSEEVSPANTQIFDYQGKPRLTLITCIGNFNQMRRLMRFDLVSVK